MKQVNAALKDIGIPVYAGVWRATSPNQNPPVQYCVYSTTTTEASHHDDHVTSFRTYVYLNLWSDIDPTDMADTIPAGHVRLRLLHGGGIRQGLQPASLRHSHPAVHGAVDMVLEGGCGLWQLN